VPSYGHGMTGKFKEVSRSGRLIGFELLCDNTLFFHGARDVSQEDLTELYPEFDFHALKQTHSCRLVPASKELLEADAHWTDQRKIALRISTADCLPVLVSHPAFICAIHAGWRGVHNGIIPESLNNL